MAYKSSCETSWLTAFVNLVGAAALGAASRRWAHAAIRPPCTPGEISGPHGYLTSPTVYSYCYIGLS